MLEMLELLYEKYPKAFMPGPEIPLPLKLGISEDILRNNEDIATDDLNKAMRYYTDALRYHKAVVKGTRRYDLDGDVVGVVTDKEREHSRSSIAGIRRTIEKKRPYYCLLMYKNSIRKNGTEHKYITYVVKSRATNVEIGCYPNKKMVMKAVGETEVQFIKNELTPIMHAKYMNRKNKREK